MTFTFEVLKGITRDTIRTVMEERRTVTKTGSPLWWTDDEIESIAQEGADALGDAGPDEISKWLRNKESWRRVVLMRTPDGNKLWRSRDPNGFAAYVRERTEARRKASQT